MTVDASPPEPSATPPGPPAPPAPQAPPARSSPWKPLLGSAALVGLVAASAFGVHRFGGLPAFPTGAAAVADEGAPAPEGPPPLVEGHDYYVHLKLVEFRPTAPGGGAWDWGDSGPDPVYRLSWQGNTVHTSSVRKNTLIGSWDLFAANVKEVMIDQAGRIDVETLVDAPLVRFSADTTVGLTIADDEPLGMGETIALETDLALADFHLGDNALRFTPEEQPAIARVVLTFTDRSSPLPDLLQLLSDR